MPTPGTLHPAISASIPPDEMQEARNSWRKWALGKRLAYDALIEAGFSTPQAMQVVTASSFPVTDLSPMGGFYDRLLTMFGNAIEAEDAEDDDDAA